MAGDLEMNETLLEIIKSVLGVGFGGTAAIFWKWRLKKKRESSDFITATAQADKTKAEADQIRGETKLDMSDRALAIANSISTLLELSNKELREEVAKNRAELLDLRRSLNDCLLQHMEDDLRFRKLEAQMAAK